MRSAFAPLRLCEKLAHTARLLAKAQRRKGRKVFSESSAWPEQLPFDLLKQIGLPINVRRTDVSVRISTASGSERGFRNRTIVEVTVAAARGSEALHKLAMLEG